MKIAESISKLAQNEIVRVVESGSVKVVDRPSSRNATSSSLPVQNSLIGFIFGFLIATIIALLIEVLDFRIKNEDDIENRYNIPLLGSVPVIKFD
jgi:succinoglycan biosynthesis transport protein ExoP